MMTKPLEPLHPMACRCRACRAPQQVANLAPRRKWSLHPIAKVTLVCCAFWGIIGAIAFLTWGA